MVFLLLFVAQAPGYAPPEACAACHREIAASYAKTPMAQTFGKVAADTRVPPLAGFTHEASNQTFTLTGKLLRRSEGSAGVNVLEKALDYWLGSGRHARSYLSRTSRGELIELPVTWYAENGGYWAMSPAYDSPRHPGFSRKVTYRCMFCHNAYPGGLVAGADHSDQATRWPAALPSGIDCQRCHGPGLAHASNPLAPIVNPSKLDAQRRDEVCLQCHLETTNAPLPGFVKRAQRGVFSYRPGEPLGDYGVYFDHAPGQGFDDKFEFAGAAYRLRQSQCFLRSEALTCTTCHKAHRETVTAEYDAACQSCHRTLTAASHSARMANCASCHMPRRRPDDAIHVTVVDHRIVRALKKRTDPVVERRDSVPYSGPVVVYYPPGAALKREVVARAPEAKSVVEDPESGEWQNSLGLKLLRAGDVEGAERALREAVRLRPELPSLRVNLGSLLARKRDWPGMRYEFSQALLHEPEAEVFSAYGSALALEGDWPPARERLATALRMNPKLWNTENNLGTVLEKLGDGAGAVEAYRRAIVLRPEFPLAHYNLGVALSALGNTEAGRSSLEAALRLARRSGDGALARSAELAMERLVRR